MLNFNFPQLFGLVRSLIEVHFLWHIFQSFSFSQSIFGSFMSHFIFFGLRLFALRRLVLDGQSVWLGNCCQPNDRPIAVVQDLSFQYRAVAVHHAFSYCVSVFVLLLAFCFFVCVVCLVPVFYRRPLEYFFLLRIVWPTTGQLFRGVFFGLCQPFFCCFGLGFICRWCICQGTTTHSHNLLSLNRNEILV